MRIPKIVWKVMLVVLLISLMIVGYLYLKQLEVTKVTLKCKEKFLLFKNPSEDISYYKITKFYFEDEPLNLYSSSPNTDSKDFSYWLVGVGEKMSKVNGITFEKKYYYPDYYTFVTDTTKNINENSVNNIPVLQTVTYINRNKLNIESTFIGDGKKISEGQCEIVDNNEFIKDWESKKGELKKKMKI